MKLIHVSDLHLGKRVNEFPMLEDQKYILNQILKVIDKEQPDAVLIAGDIYDKSVPSADAVKTFDDFLVELSGRTFRGRKLQTFVVSGNHDSPERLAFGSRLMDASGVHLSPVYAGRVAPVTLTDEFGKVNVYMLPFIKPVHVRQYYPEAKIENYTDALATAIGSMGIDTSERNVLIAHQFVTGAERSDSEEVSIGGLDNVDASVFDGFDYVALGHIHGPQNIGSKRIRYCGTPLKYSFSEVKHQKSVTVAELGGKGALNVRTVPLTPARDMVELRGSYNELMSRDFYLNTGYQEDYVRITLTDEDEILNAMANMRTIYHNLMKIAYDNTRTRSTARLEEITEIEKKSPLDLFSEFYEQQNGTPLTEEQTALLKGMIEKIWEGEE